MQSHTDILMHVQADIQLGVYCCSESLNKVLICIAIT